VSWLQHRDAPMRPRPMSSELQLDGLGPVVQLLQGVRERHEDAREDDRGERFSWWHGMCGCHNRARGMQQAVVPGGLRLG